MFIRIFLKNYDDKLRKSIFSSLKEIISHEFKELVEIKFISSEKYWKIPKLTEVIFEIIFSNKLKVKDLTLIFNLKWFYRFSEYFNNKGELILSENSIWDKDSYGGIFLNENASWVQVYTLDEV